MKMTIFRLNGQVINIGDWDYMYSKDDITGENTIVRNPLPIGATSSEEDVTKKVDGSLEISTSPTT